MGRRVQEQGVPLLKDLCQRALLGSVDRVRHLGAVPQYLVAGVLEHCTAEQLETIEHYNPHIIADNEALWRGHCVAKYKDRCNEQTAQMQTWRQRYWDMRRQDEIRAEQIMERVRNKTAEVEQRRNSRKIQVAPPGIYGRARGRVKGPAGASSSLMQHARMQARAHMQILEPPGGSTGMRRPSSGMARTGRGGASLMCPTQMSPAGSPAQSPPHHSPSYSPPYLSSASSCSPPYSNCSPPYSNCSPPHVPDAGTCGSQGEYSPQFNVFEDLLGVSPSPASLPPTVIIKERQPRRRRARPAADPEAPKRSKEADDDRAPRKRPREDLVPEVKAGSEDLADPGAKDLFRMLSG
ncbi:Elongin-A [Coemansia sp. RSA 552]|nr:Elongin-A [Coemansia sp. RSA 552]